MRAHRADQLELVYAFASGSGCRMLRLIRHFGERDDRELCGLCDSCAPQACVGRTFRPPTPRERDLIARIVQGIGSRDGGAAGSLHRTLFPGDRIERQEFERYVDALVRARIVSAIDDSFEKDGKTLRFRRLYLRAQGGTADELAASVQLEGYVEPTSPQAARPRRRRLSDADLDHAVDGNKAPRARRGKKREKAVAAELGVAHVITGRKPARAPRAKKEAAPQPDRTASLADAALVARLRAWRLGIAKSRRMPAYRVLTDQTLLAVATLKPRTMEALMGVKGIGAKIAERYGQALLAVIASAS